MKIIYATRGEEILVDDDYFEWLNQYKWFVNADGYAARTINHPLGIRRQTMLPMHRLILGLEFGDPRKGDHRFGRKLDNRRSELRICSSIENSRNRLRNANNKSGFKGVTLHKRSLRWVAKIRVRGKGRYLGLYETAEEAHEVYCLWADMLFGEFSNYGS
jgi:hypothetical protein